MSEEEEVTSNPETTLIETMNFNKDVLSLVISLIVSVIFILFGWYLLSDGSIFFVILGFILLTYGVFSGVRVFNNFGSALNYNKAQVELDVLYLRRNEPICPYLKSSYSGFICRLEFQEPFNIKTDLPI